jgi:hypothetical protein
LVSPTVFDDTFYDMTLIMEQMEQYLINVM